MKNSWLFGICLIFVLGVSVAAHESAWSDWLKPNELVRIHRHENGIADISIIKLPEPEGYLVIASNPAGNLSQSFIRGWDDMTNANRRMRHSKAYGCDKPNCGK